MNKRPTLRDVAKHSGLSLATVSMALRERKHFPAPTLARIHKAVKALGYRSDPMLAALSAHRWKRSVPSGSTLVALADGEKLNEERELVERARVHGYKLEVLQIQDYPDGQHLSDILYHRGILGLIVGPITTPGFCESFEWSRFLAVSIGEGFYRPPVHVIMPNHFQAVQEAWDQVWAHGYRHIGLALFDAMSYIDYQDRCGAFLARQQFASDAPRIPVLITMGRPGHDKSESQRCMTKWVRQHKVEVVLAFNSAFYWLLREAGWRIPEQVNVIDLFIRNRAVKPQLPGLILPEKEIAHRAIDWLDSLLRTGERGVPVFPATMAINMQWDEGEPSVGLKTFDVAGRQRMVKIVPSAIPKGAGRLDRTVRSSK